MKCQQTRRLLDRRLSDEQGLSSRDHAALQEHLAGCTGCAAFALALQEGLPALKRLPTAPPAPRALAALHAAPVSWWSLPATLRLRRWGQRGASVVAGVLLFALVAGLLLTLNQVRPGQAATSPAATVVPVASAVPGVAGQPGTVCDAGTPTARVPDDKASALALQQAIFEAAAKALNLTPQALKLALGSGQTLGVIAAQQHIALDQVQEAALAAGKAFLDDAIRAGTLTQADADALARSLPDLTTKLLAVQAAKDDRGTPVPPKDPSSAANDAAQRALSEALIAAAAQQLAVSVEQVQAALDNGTLIGTLAQQRGIGVQAVRDAMLTAGRAYINEATTRGSITTAQATDMLAELPLWVEKLTAAAASSPAGPVAATPCDKVPPASTSDAVFTEKLVAALQASAASALGLTPEAFKQAQAADKSITDLANERNVNPEEIATAMLAAGKDFLARAVARGELTPSLADGHANELPDTVKKVMMAPGQSPANKATPGTKP